MGSGHLRHHWDAQHGFDREAALARLDEHPEVMPPHPEPYHAHKREQAELRIALLAAIAVAGVALPLAIAGALRR
jgi:hypothetical protein